MVAYCVSDWAEIFYKRVHVGSKKSEGGIHC